MKIFIVDDHPLVRKGLTAVFSFENDIDLVGESDNVNGAIELINKSKPDIVLVDLRLGNDCGLEIISKVKQQNHDIKFIILTSSASYEHFELAENLKVDGYIFKEALPEEMLYAIRLVARGRKYYDPELIDIRRQRDTSSNEKLTEREYDVLRALSRGLSNKQIARELYITENTVKKHVSQILSKLNLQDRTQAALYAVESDIKNNTSNPLVVY